MRTLIITVAGIGSRFNKDFSEPVLKALYSEGPQKISLLSQQLSMSKFFDTIVIVGGYLFDKLKLFVEELPEETRTKILLVQNEHYSDYGSAYSLYLGLMTPPENCGEVVFIEGDLYIDNNGWRNVVMAKKDVISINQEVIYSDKAVVIYVDLQNHPHYLYDINHGKLEIHEPFRAIFNSGQFWKFMNVPKLREIIQSLNHNQLTGTNLEIIERYYADYTLNNLDIILINPWINCNTVMDYHKMLVLLKQPENENRNNEQH